MFENHGYFPILSVKPAEMTAIDNLPSTDKRKLLPVISLKKWATSKSLDNSIDKIRKCMGERSVILDLGLPISGTGADKELSKLRSPRGGFSDWVSFLGDHPQCVPTVQAHSGDPNAIRKQVEALLRLGRGLVLRFRQAANWNTNLMEAITNLDTRGASILCIFDVGQIYSSSDLTLLASSVSSAAENVATLLAPASPTMAIAGSSFPSDFVSINRESAKIDIQERRLHTLVNEVSERSALAPRFRYGDYGSVFAGERGFAQTVAIRVDYPSQAKWIYHRREHENPAKSAAVAIMQEPEWDDRLVIWGSEEIRRAAAGNVSGLERQGSWTAVRIHLHLHRQLNFDDSGGFLATDEPWTD